VIVENKAVDALSRHIFILTKMSTVINGFEKINADCESCPDFCNVYTILIDGSIREVEVYTLHDGHLFLGRKLCILRTSLREFLVWELHVGVLAGYFRNEKTIEAMEYRFYWSGLKRDVAKHVGRCYICQLAKQQKQHTSLYTPLPVPNCS